MSTIRRSFWLIGPERRRKFLLVGLLGLLMSGLEAVAAVMVFVLLGLVLQPGEIPEFPILGKVDQYFPQASYEQLVIWFAAAFGTFYVLRASLFIAQQYVLARVSENTGALLAHTLLDGYLSMPYAFHLDRNSAEVMRNAYDSVQQVVNLVLKPVATLFAELILIVALIAVLVVASPVATALAVILLSLSLLITFAFVQPRLKRLGVRRQQAAHSAIKHIQQGLGALRDIKILGRERSFSNSFKRARSGMARVEYRRALLISVPRVSIETIFLAFVVLVLVWSVTQDSVETVLPTLGLFAYAGMRLQPSVQRVASSLNSLRFAQAAVDELSADFRALQSSVAVRDREETDPDPLPFEDEIGFDGVTFKYREDLVPAISEVNLTIRRGESVGIAGRTGGGKTTFLDLLCGLLSPSEGKITVDGFSIADRTRAWQRNIGVVHQSSFLIDDTVRSNVAFGLPEQEIDDESLWLALEMAEISDFVKTLPEGGLTLVGERGIKLSGGQRQRIALARALYRRPNLLVLDEGTSALDNTTEAKVMSNLSALPGKATVVIVAHRLTTIMRCDRIVFFEDGRITGIGDFEDLRRSNPNFRTMAT